jgi:hypothetical protein
MTTKKPTIFIASSGRALPLAKQLQLRLKKTQAFDEPLLWAEESWGKRGPAVTDLLKDWALKSDFVAAVLTKDDVTEKQGVEHLSPRDNCIFEAGLFAGALGMDLTRCFLVCSVDDQALPSDLRGLNQIRFREPDLANNDEIVKAVGPICDQIEAAVSSRKLCCYDRPTLPLITKDDLLQREQLRRNGGSLKIGAVVVNAVQPLEVNYEFAVKVRENMAYGVNYIYFFYADPSGTGIDFIWTMIQMIALAGQIEGGDVSLDERSKIMKAKRSAVEENLHLIQQHLAIHFLSCPASLQFCVHNADSTDHARSYVRYSEEQFIEFHPGDPWRAKSIADGITNECLPGHADVVFRSTRHFELDASKNTAFRSSLDRGMTKYFVEDQLRSKVREICFGGLREVPKVG